MKLISDVRQQYEAKASRINEAEARRFRAQVDRNTLQMQQRQVMQHQVEQQMRLGQRPFAGNQVPFCVHI